MSESLCKTSATHRPSNALALILLLACSAPLPAFAQGSSAAPAATDMAGTVSATAGQDFPADAQTLSAGELDARLRGKVYTATLASGVRWRADYKASGYVFVNTSYKASGYVFVNTSSGGKDTGQWRTEDGKVCVEYRGRMRSGCTEMRGSVQALYAKSSSTGVVTVLHPD